MKHLKRNIAIVCGGDSSEHDVSLRSAQGLYSFFDKERYNVYIVDEAEIENEPSNINHSKDVILFALIGLVLSSAGKMSMVKCQ